MKVKELIRRLQMFDPETEVTMTIKEIRNLKVKKCGCVLRSRQQKY